MEIILIYAEGSNRAFGNKQRLPWNVPEDLRHFKDVTKHHAVLMGRLTWESLPPNVRPLPGRMNLVLTRQGPYHPTSSVSSLTEAVKRAAEEGHVKLFIIGGPLILEQAQRMAHRIIRTVVPYSGPFDVGAPQIDLHEWKLTNLRKIPTENSPGHFHIEEYVPMAPKRKYRPGLLKRIHNWVKGED